MKALNDLLSGIRRTGEGIAAFYQDRALWRFALIPFLLMLAVYGALCQAALAGSAALAQYLRHFCEGLPDCLQWFSGMIRAAALLTAAAAVLLLIALTVSTLYELMSGLFFDGLVAAFERRKFHAVLPEKSLAFTLRFLLDSLLYSFGTLFWMAAAAVAGLIFPAAGPLAAIVLVGYRFGVVYLAAAGFNYRWSLAQVRCFAARRKALTIGFGGAIYLLLLIPPAVIFCLPGFVLGGALLLRGSAGRNGSAGVVPEAPLQ